jgi:hypothetical protein
MPGPAGAGIVDAMSNIWHIGLAVPDLDAGMDYVGDLFDLRWRPVVTRSLTIVDERGRRHDVDCDLTFSMDGPFAVELWQAIPGTPLATPESGWLHHIGYWVQDYRSEGPRLAELGFTPFLTSDSTLLLSRGPGNLRVEPCDLHRDRPYLRDLYPPNSDFASEPVFPNALGSDESHA